MIDDLFFGIDNFHFSYRSWHLHLFVIVLLLFSSMSRLLPVQAFQPAPFFSFDTVHQIVELPADCPWADWERPVC